MDNSSSSKQENRVRRLAKRLGYRVERSRQRTIHSNNHGLYMLVDDYRNYVVDGDRYDASLEHIEARLRKEAANG